MFFPKSRIISAALFTGITLHSCSKSDFGDPEIKSLSSLNATKSTKPQTCVINAAAPDTRTMKKSECIVLCKAFMTSSSLAVDVKPCFWGSEMVLGGRPAKAIVNNTEWVDKDGSPIEARGGSIFDNRFNRAAEKRDKKFFWYGATGKNISADDRKINCYESKDLVHWDKCQNFSIMEIDGITAATFYRGGVIYHPGSANYIYYGKNRRIYTAKRPDGEFTELETGRTSDKSFSTVPVSMKTGEVSSFPVLTKDLDENENVQVFSVYQEDVNQATAYLIVNTVRRKPEDKSEFLFRTNIYLLSEDFQSLEQLVWRDLTTYLEAPAAFIKTLDGVKTYYVSASQTKGWGPSDTYFKSARGGFDKLPTNVGVHGLPEWQKLTADFTEQQPIKSFQSQHDLIINIKNAVTGADQFMYLGDRWSDDEYRDNDSNGTFYNYENKNLVKEENGDKTPLVVKASKYHWAPITFGNKTDIPYISTKLIWQPQGLKIGGN